MSWWIAEDVPWYQVSRTSPHSMTDEDYAISMPREFGKFATANLARLRLAEELEQISHYDHILRGGDREKYLAAAEAVEAGVDGVRIHGRYYRIRKVLGIA